LRSSAAQAEHRSERRRIGRIDEFGLGTHDEHRQPFLQRRLDGTRQLQVDSIDVAPHQEARLQAAFRCAEAREAHVRRRQVLDVVGQLRVQEFRSVVTAHGDQALVAYLRDEARGNIVERELRTSIGDLRGRARLVIGRHWRRRVLDVCLGRHQNPLIFRQLGFIITASL
jgi:hypothetical protein